MATWENVSRIVSALPETAESLSSDGRRAFEVKGKTFAWERPLRRGDLLALGSSAPKGDILGVRVDLELKEALLANEPDAFFTTPHFNGYPAILIRLGRINVRSLKAVLLEGWFFQAPKRLAAQHRATLE